MKAAFYECDITPPLGGHMPGYYRPNPARDVFERLYAKALVVEDEGEYAAIVAIDTCEIDPSFTEAITKRVETYTGIRPSSVCIHAVHTHKGAPTEDRPEVGQYYDGAYTDVLLRLAADAITLAYRRLETAEVYFGKGYVNGISFNRNYLIEGGGAVSFGGNGKRVIGMLAGTDPELPVLSFFVNGRPIGALICFACHQDCTGDEVNGYSGDYSSALSAELKNVYGRDFVSLFMIGTAGDINHINPDVTVVRPPFWYREMGKRIAQEAVRVMADSRSVGSGVAVAKELIRLKLRQADEEYVGKKLALWKTAYAGAMRTRNLLHYRDTNRAAYDELWLQVIRIGNTCLYIYAGEIYVNFGLALKKRSPYENCMVIENSNSYGGYIPTPEAFSPSYDLYETSLCEDSRHTPDAGALMTERLLEMGNALL